MKVGDRVERSPHRLATLLDVCEVLVDERNIIIGTPSNDDTLAHLLLDVETAVVWVDENTVRLGGTPVVLHDETIGEDFHWSDVCLGQGCVCRS
jgi:hypothetical protein